MTRPQGLGKRDQEILGATKTENLPKLRSDTKPSIRETERNKQDENYSCGKRKVQPGVSFTSCRKSKIRREVVKEAG